MLDPKCLVLATVAVRQGAPILSIHYAPDDSPGSGFGPAEFGGWIFLDVTDNVPEDTDLCFFEDIPELDPPSQAIVEDAVAGTYVRDSEFAPFDYEPP